MEDNMKIKIIDFLSEKFSRTVDEKYLIADLCEDSIDRVELLFDIEKIIGRRMTDEEVLSIETVNDLIQIANKN